MERLVDRPRELAPWYNATGVSLYVAGMLVARSRCVRSADAVDTSRREFGWLGILRLGLVQTAIGAVVVLATSTLNRVMIVEFALPATVPGALVALHYAVQLVRPRFGHGSDVGGRRTRWILGGMALLAAGGTLASLATALLGSQPALAYRLRCSRTR